MYKNLSRIYNFQGTFAGKPVACNMVWPALRMAVCPSKICSIGRNMRHRWHIGSRCRTSESVVVQVLLQRALRDGWDMFRWVFLQNSPDVTVSINQTSENSDPQSPEKMGKGFKKAGTLVIFFEVAPFWYMAQSLGSSFRDSAGFLPHVGSSSDFPTIVVAFVCSFRMLWGSHWLNHQLSAVPKLQDRFYWTCGYARSIRKIIQG